jgi:signal transduction histidine kinase
VTVAQRDGVAFVQIDDRGPGFTPGDPNRVTGRGQRGNTPAAGSGLGLYTAAQAAAVQGGNLSIGNRVGGGASVTVSLPLAQTVSSLNPTPSASEAAPKVPTPLIPAPRRPEPSALLA